MPTPIDFYYMFLSRAVTNLDAKKLYMYDKNTDTLFRLVYDQGEWIPSYNRNFVEDIDILNGIMPRYRATDTNICLLETFSLKEMTDFIQDFTAQLPDDESKQIADEILRPEDLVAGTRSHSKSKKEFEVLWDYTFKFNAFVLPKYKEVYFPLGMTEATNTIW